MKFFFLISSLFGLLSYFFLIKFNENKFKFFTIHFAGITFFLLQTFFILFENSINIFFVFLIVFIFIIQIIFFIFDNYSRFKILWFLTSGSQLLLWGPLLKIENSDVPLLGFPIIGQFLILIALFFYFCKFKTKKSKYLLFFILLYIIVFIISLITKSKLILFLLPIGFLLGLPILFFIFCGGFLLCFVSLLSISNQPNLSPPKDS